VFAQVSNLTNTVNFRSYGSVISSQDFFGRPLAAGEPRRIEIGTRIGF
jgi:hypothetical protein